MLLNEVSECVLKTCQPSTMKPKLVLTVFKSWTSEQSPKLEAARSPQAVRMKWRMLGMYPMEYKVSQGMKRVGLNIFRLP